MNIHDLQVNAIARQQDYERAFRSSRRAGTTGPRPFAVLRRGRRPASPTAAAPGAAFGAAIQLR